MPGSYQLLLGGQPADPDLTTLLLALDVEESMDLPAALQLSVPVSRSADGDLTYVNDPRFAPLANLAVVASPAAGRPAAQCIFDGYVLSQKLHLETGTTNAQLTVWAQDASWLMNATEKAREWVDLSDADVAAAIFAEYGIAPADDNSDEESPAHTEDGHSLMQRGSDIQFLRMLARRNGRLCRIACTDTPGQRTGYFAKPSLGGEPAATLSLNDPVHWTVSALDLDWDVGRPTAVVARQALFSDPDPAGAAADTSDAGLALLGDRALADFAGQPMTVLLAAPVDGADELALRARSVLREVQWFVRCEGEADLERLGTVLRAGMLVALDGIGAVHSGKYLVWNVRHRITQEAHTMKFTLVRNAVGMPPSGGAGGLAGLLGAL